MTRISMVRFLHFLQTKLESYDFCRGVRAYQHRNIDSFLFFGFFFTILSRDSVADGGNHRR